MEGREIFGYLRHLGYPYNCRKRPSKKQYFYYAFLIAIYFTTTAYTIFKLKDECTKIFIKAVGWIRFLITIVFRVYEHFVMMLVLYSNIRRCHPLNRIFDDMRKSIHSRRFPKGDWSWLHIGVFLMIFNVTLGRIYFPKQYIIDYNESVRILAKYCYLSQFIIPSQVLSKRTSQLCGIVKKFRSREDIRLGKDTWALVLEQIRLEEIYLQLVDTYYFYLALIVFDALYRAIIAHYICAGLLLGFIPDVAFMTDNTKLVVAFINFSISVEALYKIWCVAHSTANAGIQREKFYAALYSLCLEDKGGFLVRHDKIVIQLERRRHMHHRPLRFFPLDHSLFYYMLSNAVGCVFIIVQFQIHELCKDVPS